MGVRPAHRRSRLAIVWFVKVQGVSQPLLREEGLDSSPDEATLPTDLTGAVAAYAVRFSPTGKLLAVGDRSGAVVLWDPVSERRAGEPIVGHGGG